MALTGQFHAIAQYFELTSAEISETEALMIAAKMRQQPFLFEAFILGLNDIKNRIDAQASLAASKGVPPLEGNGLPDQAISIPGSIVITPTGDGLAALDPAADPDPLLTDADNTKASDTRNAALNAAKAKKAPTA